MLHPVASPPHESFVLYRLSMKFVHSCRRSSPSGLENTQPISQVEFLNLNLIIALFIL
jgi:hypothetical protein